MKYPRNRAERRCVNHCNSGGDFAKKWRWIVNKHLYIGYGWRCDKAKIEHENKKSERLVVW